MKTPLSTEVDIGAGHTVLDGDPAPLKGTQPRIVGAYLLRPNDWIHQDISWCGGRPRPRRHCVRCGPSSPVKRAQPPPNFRPKYCGQTTEWMKIPLGTEIDLGPGDIVLDGDPAAPHKGHSTPTFRPMSILAKRLDGSRYHLVRRYTSTQATLHFISIGSAVLQGSLV